MTWAMALILASAGCVAHALITRDRDSALGGAIFIGLLATLTFVIWLLSEGA